MSEQLNKLRNLKVLLVTLTTGAVFQQISTEPLLVKYAVIQNISTQVVTITTFIQGALGSGILLELAAAASRPGGSTEVLPNAKDDERADLSQIYFSRTTAGLTLAVYYEA